MDQSLIPVLLYISFQQFFFLKFSLSLVMARWVLLLISDKLYNFQVLTRGVQSIRQSAKIDPTQPTGLGRFLGVGRLGLVAKFFYFFIFFYFYSGLGLVRANRFKYSPNPTRPTYI